MQGVSNPKRLLTFDQWFESQPAAQDPRNYEENWERWAGKELAPVWLQIIFAAEPDYFCPWRCLLMQWKFIFHLRNNTLCPLFSITKYSLFRILDQVKEVGQREEIQDRIAEMIETYTKHTKENQEKSDEVGGKN